MFLFSKSLLAKGKTLLPGFLLGSLVTALVFQFMGLTPAGNTAVAQTPTSAILFQDDFNAGYSPFESEVGVVYYRWPE